MSATLLITLCLCSAEIPDPPAIAPDPPSLFSANKKVKASVCSGLCDCGCQEGGVCICGTTKKSRQFTDADGRKWTWSDDDGGYWWAMKNTRTADSVSPAYQPLYQQAPLCVGGR